MATVADERVPHRALGAGDGGFGALFAAGWAMRKVYKRKSGPL